jgi:hypothetical protein
MMPDMSKLETFRSAASQLLGGLDSDGITYHGARQQLIEERAREPQLSGLSAEQIKKLVVDEYVSQLVVRLTAQAVSRLLQDY